MQNDLKFQLVINVSGTEAETLGSGAGAGGEGGAGAGRGVTPEAKRRGPPTWPWGGGSWGGWSEEPGRPAGGTTQRGEGEGGGHTGASGHPLVVHFVSL